MSGSNVCMSTSKYLSIHILPQLFLFISDPLTFHSTQNPPPDQAIPQSVAPVGLVLESFPVANSRSHIAPEGQALRT